MKGIERTSHGLTWCFIKTRSGPDRRGRVRAHPSPEWAAFFAATEAKRDAVRAGAVSIVSVREADDLVSDDQAFLALVEQALSDCAEPGDTRLDEG